MHLDVHLGEFVSLHGAWVYALLFLIVFCETGLVVTPFLPGDSLLFVAGIGAMPYLRYLAFCIAGAVIWVAALCTVGYFFGNIPVVKNNLTVVILVIVFVSISPGLVAWARARLQRQG